MRLGAVVVGVAAMLLGGGAAGAMRFERVQAGDGNVFIAASGPIANGDSARLATVIDGMPARERLLGLAITSPGGALLESERLADLVRARRMPVMVLGDGVCASACFLVFAGAPKRYVSVNAMVGVHSASDAGRETMGSMALTTAMARDAKAMGVPPGIIGRMVTTQPGEIAWLSEAELRSMGTVFLSMPDRLAEATPDRPSGMFPRERIERPPGFAMRDPTPSFTPAPQAPSAAPAFRQGATDRQAWEQWYGSLTGEYRQGAQWWSAERSKTRPGTCHGGGTFGSDWTSGCLAAQDRLGTSDRRRRADAEYRAGWNSL